MGKKAKRTGVRRREKALPKGTFEASPKGYGFIKTSEGDFFIPRSGVNGAMDGDIVEVSRRSGSSRAKGRERSANRPEARVVRVLERAALTVIGRYEVAGPFGIVIPDDPRIIYDVFTKRSDAEHIEDGSLVRVRILEYPTRKTSAFGIVEEVIGDADDISLISQKVISRYDLETSFSQAAIDEAKACEVDVEGACAEGYRDLRDRFIFTIDPADARDFDDALSIDAIDAPSFADLDIFLLEGACDRAAKEGSLFRLGVHIADVSHYIAWNSPLDAEAKKRTTSVYLPDRVLPMLPEELSNGICSLAPGEERRAFSVDVYLTKGADVLGYDLYPSIIRSSERLDYAEAARIIEGSPREGDRVGMQGILAAGASLAAARARYRRSQGGLEFNTQEAKVILDAQGYPVDVVARTKTASTMLVEEAMILANEIVAGHLFDASWPCAYRVHENPALDALSALIPIFQEFKWFTREMAYGLGTANPHAIQAIIEESTGRLEEELVNMLLLRAMKRAMYSPENQGHFGIGSAAYCHFTSPIRRYPDLIVHRMLKSQLFGRGETFGDQVARIPELCERSSTRERTAEAASYDAAKAYMALYMQKRIGERFEGLVSGVASYGLYVRVESCIEGLVPIRTLGDEYFHFDEVRYTLTGDNTRTVYRLGQRMEVVLGSVDVARARIDFLPAS